MSKVFCYTKMEHFYHMHQPTFTPNCTPATPPFAISKMTKQREG